MELHTRKIEWLRAIRADAESEEPGRPCTDSAAVLAMLAYIDNLSRLVDQANALARSREIELEIFREEATKSQSQDGGAGLFHILDARTVVGNCAMFWAPDGQGYVCDLAKAGVYRRDQLPRGRDTDIPVPVEVAKRLAVTHVRIEALRGEGLLDALNKARAEEQRQRELEERELGDGAKDTISVLVERLAEAALQRMADEDPEVTDGLDDLWPDAVDEVTKKLSAQFQEPSDNEPSELAELRAEYHPARLAAYTKALQGSWSSREVRVNEDVCRTCFDAGLFCIPCY